MAPCAGAVVVVTNAHLASFGIQDVGTMASGVHPCIDDLFRRDAAPSGILAGRIIGHTVVIQNGEALGTIGTNVRVHSRDFFGTLHSSCVVVVIAQSNGLQTSLCALFISLPPICLYAPCAVRCNLFATLSFRIRNSYVTRVSQKCTSVKRFGRLFAEKMQLFLKIRAFSSSHKRNKAITMHSDSLRTCCVSLEIPLFATDSVHPSMQQCTLLIAYSWIFMYQSAYCDVLYRNPGIPMPPLPIRIATATKKKPSAITLCCNKGRAFCCRWLRNAKKAEPPKKSRLWRTYMIASLKK